MRLIGLISLVSFAASFSPAAIVTTKPCHLHTSGLFMAKKSALTTPTIPNPLKSLPWNIKKEQERQNRRLKTESAKLHRELGIAEDATFEEIQEVTNRLIAKAEAEGDVKKKIKVEVAKDRIMQIKLNERLAGLTELTEDAKAQSRLEEAEMDDEDLYPEEKSSMALKMPSFLDGIIQKPDEKWRNRQIKVFGIMTLICWVLPPMAEKIIMINWLFAAGQIGRRGMSENIEADFNPYTGKRTQPHQRTAIFLSMLMWISLKVWTGMLGNIKFAFGPRYAIVIEATIMNVCLGLFTAYVQTYKGK
mmetsp:Transcript_12905/g.24235  ORF Transcript_12905/g.24235 Transcript_12905/m.24235 type:complete len:304 (+) Transcript_12905:215-1126(+)